MPGLLVPDDLKDEALNCSRAPSMLANGKLDSDIQFFHHKFSDYIKDICLAKFMNAPHFSDLRLVATGSWVRNELCPLSDLDFILLGDHNHIKQFVDHLEKDGVKLRYRTPADINDWTIGVRAFDILALLNAKGLDKSAQNDLLLQSPIFNKYRHGKGRRYLFKELLLDRIQRKNRYESIAHFLEPQIKQGPGGLRDIDQAHMVMDLFPELFLKDDHIKKILIYYKSFFTSLRQRVNLLDKVDYLTALSQEDLAKWCGYSGQKEIMRDVQRGLARVHFYTDWIFSYVRASKKQIEDLNRLKFNSIESMVLGLLKSPSLLVQKQIRLRIDHVKKINIQKRVNLLNRFFLKNTSDESLVGLFQSHLIDYLLPEIIPLIGYCQHDQYHRYTADAHILQVCRQVNKLRSLERRKLHKDILVHIQKEFSEEDWKIISWAALLHDLGKGQGLGEDHGIASQKISRPYVDKIPLGENAKKSLVWIIENHLELTQAAFRKNPQDQQILRNLVERGLSGKNLLRLYVFTIADILGTNPEAWTQWKAKLLADLVLRLRNPHTVQVMRLEKYLQNKKVILPSLDLEGIDHLLLDELGETRLGKDIVGLKLNELKIEFRVFSIGSNKRWVRVHIQKDSPGLLNQLLTRFFHAGLMINHASIHTFRGIGVYDWFCVSSKKSTTHIKRLLETVPSSEVNLNNLGRFSQLEWVSISDQEWILSLRAKDQRGLLLRASYEISKLGLNICGARVHTWGNEVDDLIHISPPMNISAEDILKQLGRVLVSSFKQT